jgi:hypothetical protein
MNQPITVLTVAELEDLLIRAAMLGASEALKARDSDNWPAVMTKKELSKYLRKSIDTINRLMRDDPTFPFEKKGKEHPRFHKERIDRWLSTKDSRENESSTAIKTIPARPGTSQNGLGVN